MNLTFELDLDRVKVNLHVRYLGQWSFRIFIVHTHTHTHTPTHWTTRVVGETIENIQPAQIVLGSHIEWRLVAACDVHHIGKTRNQSSHTTCRPTPTAAAAAHGRSRE